MLFNIATKLDVNKFLSLCCKHVRYHSKGLIVIIIIIIMLETYLIICLQYSIPANMKYTAIKTKHIRFRQTSPKRKQHDKLIVIMYLYVKRTINNHTTSYKKVIACIPKISVKV